MKPIPILVVLVVAGYVGFELFALQRTKYRTEPLYIFDQFLLAHHAVTKCGSPGEGRLAQFRRNLRSVAARAARELAESNPESSPEQIERMIDARDAEREREVDAIVQAKGCEDPQIKTLLKRFEIRARLRVG
jgi:hypothetical protein